MLEEYLKVIRPLVEEMFEGDSGGHDVYHLERTMNIALYIQQREGGDRVVVGLGAFLHDVHRMMEHGLGRFVSPEESLGPIRELLAKVDLAPEQVDAICYVVEHHEHYNWNGDNVDDINALIVQDADNLDAIGALGVARAFSYGGMSGLPLYDPSVPLESDGAYQEGEGADASTMHHFFHKCLRLGNHMNTATGAELAAQRTAFMRNFADQFLAEWTAEL